MFYELCTNDYFSVITVVLLLEVQMLCVYLSHVLIFRDLFLPCDLTKNKSAMVIFAIFAASTEELNSIEFPMQT